MADAEEPKKPLNAYWLWLADCRDALNKEAGQGKAAVAKLSGAKWKVVSDGTKKTYEERAAGLKAEYVKLMEEFKTAGGVVAKRTQGKAGLNMPKDIKKARKQALMASGKPKRPPPAYWIWLGENREELTRGAVSARGSDVAKFAGEKWKGLADSIKAPFESRAVELRVHHQKEMEEWRKKSNESGSDDDNDGDVDEGVEEN